MSPDAHYLVFVSQQGASSPCRPIPPTSSHFSYSLTLPFSAGLSPSLLGRFLPSLASPLSSVSTLHFTGSPDLWKSCASSTDHIILIIPTDSLLYTPFLPLNVHYQPELTLQTTGHRLRYSSQKPRTRNTRKSSPPMYLVVSRTFINPNVN